MLKNIFNSRVFNFIFIFVYIFIILIWLMIYILIDEDVELNTMQMYFAFNGFNIVFYFMIFLFLKFSHSKISKMLVVLFGVILTPILVAGFLGAIDVNVTYRGLVYTRLIVLILHLFIMGYGISRIIKFFQ